MATVFVTGFPGFIGSELVVRLLARYPVDVHIACLVQDSYFRLAKERIREIERLDETYKGRIYAWPGDIRHPNLSLDGQYGFLSDETVEIFHLAAVYDLGVRREVGTAVNLEGMRHVLDFAARCPHLRRFHYVSTCYVSGNYPGDFRENNLVKGAMKHIPGVAKFVGIEPSAMDYFTQPTRYHCENTLADLAGSGIACPPFASYAPKLVQFMQSHPEISPQAMV